MRDRLRSIKASRLVALLAGAALAAPGVSVFMSALGAPTAVAHFVAAVVALGGAYLVHKRVPGDLAAVERGSALLFGLWLALSAVAIYKVSSLALFIDDASRAEHAYQRNFREMDDPELTTPFYLKHNCSTCYIVAAHLAGSGVENLYDRKYYRNPEEPTPIHDSIGETFSVDQYQYPPPFLLGPYFFLSTGLDFFQIRAIFFALSVILFALTSGALTVWICGWRFHALWLIWPAMLISPSIMATLQMGNAHAFMILIAVLAMVCFEKRWFAAGGALLAYATLSKFFPGILVVYLMLRRKWRAAAWTVGWAVALCGVTLVIFGATPFRAFLSHQLPAIASGDAFWFAFEKPGAMLGNSSVMGIPIKLDVMGIGLPWDAMTTARVLTWIYTALVLAVLVIVARRGVDSEIDTEDGRLSTVRLWMALIVLAQLRSPFLPGTYGNTAMLLLLAMMLPLHDVRPLRLVLIALGVAAYALILPLPFGPVSSAFDYGYGVMLTLFAVGLAVMVALWRTDAGGVAEG